jgi:hypothetical protein
VAHLVHLDWSRSYQFQIRYDGGETELHPLNPSDLSHLDDNKAVYKGRIFLQKVRWNVPFGLEIRLVLVNEDPKLHEISTLANHIKYKL